MSPPSRRRTRRRGSTTSRSASIRSTALQAAKARLEAAGVEVLGITDHHIIESIYFFDPNGIRLELTTPTASAETTARHAREAHAAVEAWTLEKRSRLAGAPVLGVLSDPAAQDA